MPRIDSQRRSLRSRSGCKRARLQPHAARCAARLASTGQLMAQGSGLVIPRLGGVPLVHRLVADDRLAVLLAQSLLELDIATPADWAKAEYEPTPFIEITLGRWIGAHGGPDIQRRFILEARISTSPSAWADEDEANPQRLFLTVEPSEAGCLVFGPTLDLLEKCHPRLPATFFYQFVAALNRWARVYDLRDAEERIENLKDWIANEPDADQYELPDVQGSIPPCMKQPPLGLKSLSLLVGRITEPLAAKLVAGLLDLKNVSEKAERPQLDDCVGELLSDCNPPLPSLLAIFAESDGIAAAFDEESEGMMEVTPEPNLIIPFDPGDRESVGGAFKSFGVACETLAAASRLMDLMPGNDKWIVSG
jgi:hypothetical protein